MVFKIILINSDFKNRACKLWTFLTSHLMVTVSINKSYVCELILHYFMCFSSCFATQEEIPEMEDKRYRRYHSPTSFCGLPCINNSCGTFLFLPLNMSLLDTEDNHAYPESECVQWPRDSAAKNERAY